MSARQLLRFSFVFLLFVCGGARANFQFESPRPRLRPAEYVFEHPFTLYGHKFKAVVLLPNFYGNIFGPPDDVDRLFTEYPRAEVGLIGRAHRIRLRAQRWLWTHFERDGTFSPAFLESVDFERFASAEQFDDGRSALVYIAVDDGNDDDQLVVPIDIRAMLRAASPRPAGWSSAVRVFESMIPSFQLPFVLRGMQNPHFAREYRARLRQHLQIEMTPDTEVVLGKKGRPTKLFPIDVEWPRAFANEFKSWSHRPMRVQVREDGRMVTKLIDFLPMLLRIAEIYKMYSRSAYTLADMPFQGPGFKVDEVRATAAHFAGRGVSDSEIGILPAEYWLECTTQQACDTYEADFDFHTEIEWDDPHLPATRTRAMRVSRAQWFQAFPRFIRTRPGKALFQDAEIQLHHKLVLTDRDLDPLSCGARMRRHTAQPRDTVELKATSM